MDNRVSARPAQRQEWVQQFLPALEGMEPLGLELELDGTLVRVRKTRERVMIERERRNGEGGRNNPQVSS